jgi:phospholipid/cholesterol/gamma-HCH transport system substrate-binding protein
MRPHTTRDALVGVVYILVIAGLVALSIAIYNHAFSSYTDVTVRAGSVGSSLDKGSDVKVRGVVIGQVESVTTNGKSTKIHLQLDPDKAKTLPHNVTAQLLPKTLFGEKYVSLVLPKADQASGKLGGTIYEDTSPVSAELEHLFADLYQVLTAVQPQKLSATLGEMAQALRGSTASELADTITLVGGYFNGLSPHVPQLTKDFEALATTAKTYAQAGPDLIDALDSASTFSQTLVSQQQDFKNVLASVSTMSKTIGNFVGTSQNQIIGLSVDSLPTLKVVARYSKEFPCISQALVNYIPKANKAFGAGTKQPGGHVVLHVIAPKKPYGPGDRPKPYTADPGPRCPYSTSTSLASTALATVPGVAGASTAATNGTVQASPATEGMGTANSPQENELIAELVAPAAGMSPAAFPKWSSLLLGPALRGTEVTVK